MPPAQAGLRDDEALLAIGALARATGIPVETLRTWESRYGFPEPRRRPSGHRLYPVSVIPRLLRMSLALAGGHRAAQVVGASDDRLDALLEATGKRQPGSSSAAPTERPALIELLHSGDVDRLTQAFRTDWARLGSPVFLDDCVRPLVRLAAAARRVGSLAQRHHLVLGALLQDMLRGLRLAIDDRASGPRTLVAALPSDDLGVELDMAALVLASAGRRVLSVGAGLSPGDLAAIAREWRALAVVLCVPPPSGRASRSWRRVREALPVRTALAVLGPTSSVRLPNVTVCARLGELDAWARRRSAGPRVAVRPAAIRARSTG